MPTSYRNRKVKKWQLIYMGIVFAIFIAIILLSRQAAIKRFERLMVINKDSKIEIEVTEYFNNRGSHELNDNIIITVGLKLKSEIPNWLEEKYPPLYRPPGSKFSPSLEDIDPPYYLIKLSDTFEFKVIKHSDTLVFIMSDPDYKDPNDPTIRDVIEKFKKTHYSNGS